MSARIQAVRSRNSEFSGFRRCVFLSEKLEFPQPTLFGWIRKGWLSARKSRDSAPVRWLIHADARPRDD